MRTPNCTSSCRMNSRKVNDDLCYLCSKALENPKFTLFDYMLEHLNIPIFNQSEKKLTGYQWIAKLDNKFLSHRILIENSNILIYSNPGFLGGYSKWQPYFKTYH